MNKILDDFISMIQESWTYNKMTDLEKSKCLEVLTHPITITSLKSVSSYKQSRDISWSILQAVYSSYLLGIGYTSPTWRENDDVPKF